MTVSLQGLYLWWGVCAWPFIGIMLRHLSYFIRFYLLFNTCTLLTSPRFSIYRHTTCYTYTSRPFTTQHGQHSQNIFQLPAQLNVSSHAKLVVSLISQPRMSMSMLTWKRWSFQFMANGEYDTFAGSWAAQWRNCSEILDRCWENPYTTEKSNTSSSRVTQLQPACHDGPTWACWSCLNDNILIFPLNWLICRRPFYTHLSLITKVTCYRGG